MKRIAKKSSIFKMSYHKPSNKPLIVKAPNKANVNRRIPPNTKLNTGNLKLLNLTGHPRSPLPTTRALPPQIKGATNAKVVTFTTVNFTGPVKPSFIFLNYPGLLTKEEEKEILHYREIYYVRKAKPPIKQGNTYQNGTFFKFVKEDHIAYRYQQEHVLGKGSFGSVLQCYDHKSQKSVAIKLLNHKPKLHSQIMFELELLKKLQMDEDINQIEESNHSDNKIIKFIDAFDFRNFFCIVMELASFDLYTFLQRQHFRGLTMKSLHTVARDTATGLYFMHKKGIIHCDIKPENLLFNDITLEGIKIIDFGCSCYVGKILYSYIQSRYYRAPEVVLGREYGPEIDIWSLGCVLCELVTGTPIFPAKDETELMEMLIKVIGMPPKSLIQTSSRAHFYFGIDQNGALIHKQTSVKQEKEQNEKEAYMRAFTEIQRQTRIRDKDLLDLIVRCLKWKAEDRLTAKDFLSHKWIVRPIKDGTENSSKS